MNNDVKSHKNEDDAFTGGCAYSGATYGDGATVCMNGEINECVVDADGNGRWYPKSEDCYSLRKTKKNQQQS